MLHSGAVFPVVSAFDASRWVAVGAEAECGLDFGPISWSCAMLSPLVGSTTPEHAVPAALIGQSNQFRESVDEAESA